MIQCLTHIYIGSFYDKELQKTELYFAERIK